MSKKALAIVGLAGVIALSAGVITYVGNSPLRGPDADPTTAAVTEAPTAVIVDTPTDATLAPTEPDTQPPTEGNHDGYGYASILTSAGSYHIAKVYDHVAGSESTPREVFGKSYSFCYLTFRGDGTFELYLNPASGEIRSGTYRVYSDVISVAYQNGTGSEFTILSSGSGGIDYIVVNYGDYDVYFG